MCGVGLTIGEDVRRSYRGTYSGREGTKGDKGGEGEGSYEVSSGSKLSLARISKELISSGRFKASRSSR